MEEKYKYMFLKYVYSKLKLKDLEQQLEKNNIKFIDDDIDGLYKDISKYFSLLNRVDISRLSEELKQKYNYYFSLPIEKLVESSMESEVYKFLEESYKMMLFPNIKENHCFYGPINYKYVAPRDSVALGFNYYEFDIEDENFDEVYSQRDKEICNMLNYIQNVLGPEAGLNVAVISYNEYSKKKIR